jgi:hypothetical protein
MAAKERRDHKEAFFLRSLRSFAAIFGQPGLLLPGEKT